MTRSRYVRLGGLILLAGVATAGGCKSENGARGTAGTSPETQPSASGLHAADRTAVDTASHPKPETRPEDHIDRNPPETVLIRVGDKEAITQDDFNRRAAGASPQQFEAHKIDIARKLVSLAHWGLHVADHPELVDEARVDQDLQDAMKQTDCQTLEQFIERLAKFGRTIEEWKALRRVMIAQSRLSSQAAAKAQDTEAMQKLYQENPGEFDGTEVSAAHILLMTAPYDTPEEVEAVRQRLVRMKQDILAGNRKWDECALESHCNTRSRGGNLGKFERHLDLRYGETVSAAAFKLKPGEISDPVRSEWGWHLVKLLDRGRPWRSFDNSLKYVLRIWAEAELFIRAAEEMNAKYPVVGVKAPTPPPPAPPPCDSAPAAGQPSPPFKLEMPAPAKPGTAKTPQSSTKPAQTPPRSATTRPAKPRQAATRPAQMRSQSRPGAATRPVRSPQTRPPARSATTRPAPSAPPASRPAR